MRAEDSTAAPTVTGELPHGACLRRLHLQTDERGSFLEVFYNTWGLGIEPAQWSLVRSQAGVMRGMHFHQRHEEYIAVVEGHASIGLRDLRPDSPTRHRSCLVEMKGETPHCLSFPSGVVHGWYFHQPSLHLQAVSETYAEYHPDDNWGCRWDDPELEIPWPQPSARLSERARGFGSLQDLVDRIRKSASS